MINNPIHPKLRYTFWNFETFSILFDLCLVSKKGPSIWRFVYKPFFFCVFRFWRCVYAPVLFFLQLRQRHSLPNRARGKSTPSCDTHSELLKHFRCLFELCLVSKKGPSILRVVYKPFFFCVFRFWRFVYSPFLFFYNYVKGIHYPIGREENPPQVATIVLFLV